AGGSVSVIRVSHRQPLTSVSATSYVPAGKPANEVVELNGWPFRLYRYGGVPPVTEPIRMVASCSPKQETSSLTMSAWLGRSVMAYTSTVAVFRQPVIRLVMVSR